MKILFLILSFFMTLTVFGITEITEIKGKNVVDDSEFHLTFKNSPKEKKGILLVFLSAKCPCSFSHEEALRGFFKEFTPKGIDIVAIHSNADESLEFAKAQFTARALPFPVIQDSGTTMADALGALKTPHAYLFNKSGEIIYQGGVDDSSDFKKAKKHFLRDALMAMVEGKTPEIKEARALGCRIKR